MRVAVVLAGGPGTGLWPHSRALAPKTVLPLVGDAPLLVRALVLARHACEEVLVVAHEEHRFLVGEHVGGATLLLESPSRGTAFAVAVAATGLAPDDILVVVPADLVLDTDAFAQAIADAAGEFEGGSGADGLAMLVDARTGRATGIVVARVDALRMALFAGVPAVAQAAEAAVSGAIRDLDFVRLDPQACARSPVVALEDVLARAPLRALRVDAAWRDVGTWDDLVALTPADPQGNAARGDVVSTGCTNTFVDARHGVVVTAGLSDTVVVTTKDAVLVAKKDAVGLVGDAVAALAGREETVSHPRTLRPWGAWERLDRGDRFQVKRITVGPGQALSLQRHARRAEHWVVVRGVAHVVRGDEVSVLREDESTYIPAGVVHRLENRGDVPLEVVEVQTGDYLGEDDIVRVEDRYGRST